MGGIATAWLWRDTYLFPDWRGAGFCLIALFFTRLSASCSCQQANQLCENGWMLPANAIWHAPTHRTRTSWLFGRRASLVPPTPSQALLRPALG
ncbi:hypothetical protein F5B21DRAFT_457795 [Xylaria acuta]|nr:hypothetical protein F5B21DRAFT_457795 [Xylaria acuta]